MPEIYMAFYYGIHNVGQAEIDGLYIPESKK
jgi:hypothetical protein